MKTLRLFSLLACTVLCSMTSNLFSQDVIFLSNGNEIEAKVVKIGRDEIEYKKWSNQDGPTYTEQKANVFMIKYQNGEKDVFGFIKEETKQVVVSETNLSLNEHENKEPYKVFFGINGGLGFGHLDNYHYGSYYDLYGEYISYFDETSWLILNAIVGADLIFPIGSVFAMGPYLSLGWRNDPTMTLGGWAMFRFNNNTALMLGSGLNVVFGWNTGISERVGFKFKNKIYLFGELTTQSDYEYEYYDGGGYEDYFEGISFILHLGFKLF